MAATVSFVGLIVLMIWALKQVQRGFMFAYGVELKRHAARLGKSWTSTFFVGGGMASLLQSSTATALIIASFAGQQIIPLQTAFIAILGADLGTVIAVVIANSRLTWLPFVFVLVGSGLALKGKTQKARNIGKALNGIGLVLLSLSLLSASLDGLGSSSQFKFWLDVAIQFPAVAVIVSALMVYAVHSSLAIILLVIQLHITALITTEVALFCVVGANFGGACLPLLANLSGSIYVKRPLLANLILKGLVAIFLLAISGYLVGFIDLQFAAATHVLALHLGFNLVVVCVGLVGSKPLLALVQMVMTEPLVQTSKDNLSYLDQALIAKPAEGLVAAQREALRLADMVKTILADVGPVLAAPEEKAMQKIAIAGDDIDQIYVETKHYTALLTRTALTEDQGNAAIDIIGFITNMENIGDIVGTGLLETARSIHVKKIGFSEQGKAEISDLHIQLVALFDLAVNTFISGDADLALQIQESKKTIAASAIASRTAHIQRLANHTSETWSTSTLHLDVVRDLERIKSHLVALSYPVLTATGHVLKNKWKRKT